MNDRELVLEAVRKLPDQSSIEDILEELQVLAELRQRLAEADRNIGLLPHEVAVDWFETWKAKAGK